VPARRIPTRRVFYRLELEDGRVFGIRINEFKLIDGKELRFAKNAFQEVNYSEFKQLPSVKQLKLA
jgi:hypothetical protein